MDWIKTSERLPDNANKPGAFCPRYQVITQYGITEGWFRPYEHKVGGRWYALIWFMREPYCQCNIDLIHGDIPKLIENIDVLAWMPLPEPPEVEE